MLAAAVAGSPGSASSRPVALVPALGGRLGSRSGTPTACLLSVQPGAAGVPSVLIPGFSDLLFVLRGPPAPVTPVPCLNSPCWGQEGVSIFRGDPSGARPAPSPCLTLCVPGALAGLRGTSAPSTLHVLPQQVTI